MKMLVGWVGVLVASVGLGFVLYDQVVQTPQSQLPVAAEVDAVPSDEPRPTVVVTDTTRLRDPAPTITVDVPVLVDGSDAAPADAAEPAQPPTTTNSLPVSPPTPSSGAREHSPDESDEARSEPEDRDEADRDERDERDDVEKSQAEEREESTEGYDEADDR